MRSVWISLVGRILAPVSRRERTSSQVSRDTAKSIAQIASELNIDLIVEGSASRSGRVTGAGDFDGVCALAAALRSENNLPPNLQFDPLFDTLRGGGRDAKLIR